MKEKENWLIVGGVAVVMVLLILGSFISPLLVYLTLTFIGVVSMINMLRIERLSADRKVETPKEELPEPPKPMEVNKEAIDKANEYLENGFNEEEIREGLKEKYTDETVDEIMKKIGG